MKKASASTSPSLFDGRGRRVPFAGMRVFNAVSKRYYALVQPEIDFGAILGRSGVPGVAAHAFEAACSSLKRKAEEEEAALAGLFGGVHVPFLCPKASGSQDLGEEFETVALEAVKASFKRAYPRLHFRATTYGDERLAGKLSLAEGSRCERFEAARRRGPVAGWYFPEALLEYDVASQIKQTQGLPLADSLVLSGGFDAAAALTGSPGLLVNPDSYPPVLCLSAFRHQDPRLVLCFKAYGQSLEFWCMSQMLTPALTQVSEQWSGGLTLFTAL